MSGAAISNVGVKSTQAVMSTFSGIHYKSREIAIGAVLGGILVGICSLAYAFFRSRKSLEPQPLPFTFGVIWKLADKLNSYKMPKAPEYITRAVEELQSSSTVEGQVKIVSLIQRYEIVLDKHAVWEALELAVNKKKLAFDFSKTSSLEEAEQKVENQFNQWLVENKQGVDLITSIDFSRHIKVFPEQIRCLSDMKGLSRLSLENNALESLPESFSQLNKLSDLSLYNNKFAILPPVICKLVKLTSLHLENNSLESLPDEFSQLSELYSLDLSDNKFREMPKCLGKMPKLRYLKFGGNPCTNASGFCQLTSLCQLSLNGNGLETLPDEFKQLSELREVNLSNNKFKEIPECLGKIAELKTIHFGGNPCTEDSDSVQRFKSKHPGITIKFS